MDITWTDMHFLIENTKWKKRSHFYRQNTHTMLLADSKEPPRNKDVSPTDKRKS